MALPPTEVNCILYASSAQPYRLSGTVETADVVIVGGGAAGLATAVFAARTAPDLRVICLDGARRVGAKILVSGGARCNVTNTVVTEQDFWGGSVRTIRSVLRAFPADRAVAFFRELGVSVHEEEDGKLFPDTNRARTVLDALLAEAARIDADIRVDERVVDLHRDGGRFVIRTAGGREYVARAVVLATGGRSLPKTGSDGFGYELARGLGHGYIDTTPGLAPLILNGAMHSRLSGVSHPAALTVRSAESHRVRLEGSLLWTHFGISGPVALNASRHWLRARLEGHPVEVLLNVCPGETFETLEAWWLEQERLRPKAGTATVLATRLPGAVASAWIEHVGIAADVTLAHLGRDDRRRLVRALLETRLDVRDSRGYNFAEVTSGGIPLDEIDPARMESRRCPHLYLVGEILDVDGRLGGFNFQWAWSSAWVAAQALARALSRAPPR
jgi:predicted Rossmann fold flavoprotein